MNHQKRMIGIEDRKQELRETYQSKEHKKNNPHDKPIKEATENLCTTVEQMEAETKSKTSTEKVEPK